jgi:hypothetical protein
MQTMWLELRCGVYNGGLHPHPRTRKLDCSGCACFSQARDLLKLRHRLGVPYIHRAYKRTYVGRPDQEDIRFYVGRNPALTNLSPARTAAIAGRSSWFIADFDRNPAAPSLSDRSTIAGSVFWETKSILDWGATEWICSAACIPSRFGIAMSRRIRSGCSSEAFATACIPSEASAAI